jgi:Fe-S-cluster-containing dehydrogenase component
MAYENYGLLFDYKYCSNCHTCEVACKNHLDTDMAKRPGIVVLEKGPYHLDESDPDAWDWDYIPVPTELCDLCAERLDVGKKPSCVHHCLGFCIEYGPVDELAKRAAEIGRKVSIFLPGGPRA